jgi:hypothetical protein
MRGSRTQLSVLLITAAAFVAVFVWAYQRPQTPKPQNAHMESQVGTAGRYSYVVTHKVDDKVRQVDFNPAVEDEDTEVLDVLRKMAGVLQPGIDVSQAQPVVQVIGEQQYVTFVVNGMSLIFELHKNGQGQVSSLRYWRD